LYQVLPKINLISGEDKLELKPPNMRKIFFYFTTQIQDFLLMQETEGRFEGKMG
jgi:hypothetical protein